VRGKALSTDAELGQIESDLIEIAKDALPPTKTEWNRYEHLRGRTNLTDDAYAEFMTLVCKARRLHVAPDAAAAEMRLFAKYGPTTGAETPRRAITDQ
jgi:hypothetical protein